MRSLKLFLLVLGWFAVVPGVAQVRPAANSAPCGGCHKSQALPQPFTPMAHATELPGSNTVLAQHPRLAVQKGAYTYTVETRGEQSTYTVSDGTSTISLPIQWSLGAGAQTWVLERNGKFYESLMSYYPSIEWTRYDHRGRSDCSEQYRASHGTGAIVE